MIGTDGLEDKLNQILNNPESMAQILSLAQSLGMQPPETQAAVPSSPEPAPSAPEPPPTAPKPSPPPASSGGMQALPSMPAMDSGMLRAMMQLMQQAQQSDSKQEALLLALKPYLAPERRDKIDRALQIARISHLAGFALRNYGGLVGKGGD